MIWGLLKIYHTILLKKDLEFLRSFLYCATGYGLQLCDERKLEPTQVGVPQSSLLSPILSNIYLNEIDKYTS